MIIKKWAKRITAITIMGMMLMAPLTSSFAEIDKDDLSYFFKRVAESKNEQKKAEALGIIKKYLVDERDFDKFRRIVIRGAEKYESELKERDYSISQLKKDIYAFEDISKKDAQELIDAIEENDTKTMMTVVQKAINDFEDKQKQEEQKKEEGSGGTPISGAGSTETPVVQPPVVEVVQKPSIEFNDMKEHWAKDAVVELASKGIFRGDANGNFNPDLKITRCEFGAILVRAFELKGKDDSSFNFTDLDQTSWYYESAKIMNDLGIMKGIDETSFGPDQEVTREQMAVMIIRLIEQLGLDQSKELETKPQDVQNQLSEKMEIKDKDSISPWALAQVQKSIDLGILKGNEESNFAPSEMTTRAQSAMVIKRILDLNKGE